MNKFKILICCLGTSLAAPASVAAELPAGLVACVDEPNDLRRLVCFDEAMQKALAISAADGVPGEVSTAPAATAAAVSQEPVAAAEPDNAPATSKEPAAPIDAGNTAATAANSDVAASPAEQSFIVREVFQQPRGENTVVLENGEVWQEPVASRYFPVKPGDRVTLKKRMFGGYRLITESGKALSVSKQR